MGSCTGAAADVAFTAARNADPVVMDRDEMAKYVADLGRVRAWCSAMEVRASRRARQLAAEGRSEPPASLLGDDGRRSSKDTHAAVDREIVCTSMPSFEDALAHGAVSS